MSAVARRDSGDYSDPQDIEQNSTNDEPESDYDSAGSDSEHSDRDPESQETERRVDDDEDRSNPQYIPKRGTFYEHDDRTAASGEEPARAASEAGSDKKEGSPPPERRRPPRKSEVIDRWTHDKYNENEQVPKSRDELVAIYGYDIRNEDAPPHARRNRRYGRGPNKYTRTWEDEEAYRRQAAAQPRKPPNPEDFPDLEQANKHRRSRGPRPRSRSQPTSTESLSNGAGLRRHASIKPATPQAKPATPQAKPATPQAKAAAKPVKDNLPQIENLTITASVNTSQSQPRKVHAVAQQRPVPTDQGRRKPAPPQQPPTPQSPSAPHKSAAPQQPAGAEPRGSKRYSSLRQRPLAETYSPQQQQQQQQQQQPQPQMRYHPEYAGSAPPPPPASQHQGSPAPQMHPPQLIHPAVRSGPVRSGSAAHGPSPPHQSMPLPPQQQHAQQVRLSIVEPPQLLPHPHHALHNLPPQPHNMGAAPALGPQPASYAPPAMLPAQYMQQPGGTGAVFGAAPLFAQPPPPPYQHPHPHPLYQHHNYATAGGVTYYTAVEQELPAAPALRAPRRPTAAIPIVRPDRPANSSEKDNIDRIVENMFVRKPWPGTQPNSDSKEPETRCSQEPPSKESSPNSLSSSAVSTESRQETEAREEERKPEGKEEERIADA